MWDYDIGKSNDYIGMFSTSVVALIRLKQDPRSTYCSHISGRWVPAGYHCQRGEAEALVRVFEEQGQED